MIRMHSFGVIRGIVILAALAAIILADGCSRQIDVPTDESAAQTDQAPFRPVGSSSIEESAPVLEEHAGSLPFHHAQSLPSGSLLTIRLNTPIAADNPDSFEGTLDEPIMVRGRVVIPRGALVSGRVEFASSTNVRPERAYVRLTLTSVHASEGDLSVRTASLFARQHNPEGLSSPRIRLEKGHRLTFRLTEPVYAATQTAQVTP